MAAASVSVSVMRVGKAVGTLSIPNPRNAFSLCNNLFSLSTNAKFLSPLRLRVPFGFSGICHLANPIQGKDHVLLGLGAAGVGDKSTVEAVNHTLEMAKHASSRRQVLHTDFLTPTVLKECLVVLQKLADIKTVIHGGYSQAERCRLSFRNSDAPGDIPNIVAALSITGNFVFKPCSHGDFLEAILGTDIARGKLGDILVRGEKGAQILVVPEIVDFLVTTLDKVGNVPVTCREIPLTALEYVPPRTKSFKTVEASLRIDAIASAGFKISRSKLVNLISGRNVRINWTIVTKNGLAVKTGDTVSIDGMGRIKIGEISTARKGKFAVELVQYL